MAALIATGDIKLVRNDTLRAAMIGYYGQLRADLGEFGSDVGLFQDLAAEFIRLMELARRPDASSGEDDVARTLVTLQRDRQAAAVFRLFQFNIEARIWYLTQMLNATREFAAILHTANVPPRQSAARRSVPGSPVELTGGAVLRLRSHYVASRASR